MSVGLSVVAPIYNEAAILPELARRCLAAARAVDPAAEVLLVDDGSSDSTREVAAALPSGVRVLHLPHNVGQLHATFAGLRAAQGAVVVVLDGDLQDPPEQIGALVVALRATPDADVAFAAKTRRDDPLWFRVGRAAYGALQALPGARAVPPGVGAYCAMRRRLAQRAARVPLPDGNLAPLLVALGAVYTLVPYEKVARYDGRSRVGPLGLVREALPSLALTGALTAFTRWSGAFVLAVGMALHANPLWLPTLSAWVLAGELAGWRARRVLDDSQGEP